MGQDIARFIESILRLLPPAARRRRSPEPSLARLPRASASPGEAIGTGRTHPAAAHERRLEEQHGQVRWRTSWLEVPSIDSSPRSIRRGEVSA